METSVLSMRILPDDDKLKSPHSLGTLIEWKLPRSFLKIPALEVPTRWGH